MPSFSFPVPIQPGKTSLIADDLPGYVREHMTEYLASRQNAGITMERVYLQTTPMGDLLAVYIEADRDLPEVLRAYATSGTAFDRHFLEVNQEATGIDLTQPPPGPPPELVGEWQDPEVLERRPALVVVAPILPGAGDRGRAFMQEAYVTRRDEMTESRRQRELSKEAVFLNVTPMGEMTCIYIEGKDPVEANRGFAASTEPFDVWFKEQLSGIYPPQIDFNAPLPPVRQVWDWQRAIA